MAYSWHHENCLLIGNGDLSGSFIFRRIGPDGVTDTEIPGELLAKFVADRAEWAVKHVYRIASE